MRAESQSINPANGDVVGCYLAMDEAELTRTVATSHAAFQRWKRQTCANRASALARLGRALEDRKPDLARTITLEMGKPMAAAEAEVDKCSNLCRWYSKNLERLLADEAVDVGSEGTAFIRFTGLGVVLGVMPWNFPLWQVLRAAVPVMAAGNGFILKHADNVQGSARALSMCVEQAGFPEGLFSVVNADRTLVSAMISDPHIVGVSVTAGVAAGAALAAEAGRHLKKSVLELGGSDPFIVLADADVEQAAEVAVTARFQNCGQVCIAAKRFIVLREVTGPHRVVRVDC